MIKFRILALLLLSLFVKNVRAEGLVKGCSHETLQISQDLLEKSVRQVKIGAMAASDIPQLNVLVWEMSYCAGTPDATLENTCKNILPLQREVVSLNSKRQAASVIPTSDAITEIRHLATLESQCSNVK